MSNLLSKTLICLGLCASYNTILAQNKNVTIPFRHSIYGEVLGQGLYNSLSYDRLFRLEKKKKTSLSAGLTLFPVSYLFVVATPISYNYLIGEKNSHLELGLGITPMYMRQKEINVSVSVNSNPSTYSEYVAHENDFYSFLTPKLGYRFQKAEGGFFFRLTLTPPIGLFNVIGNTKGGPNVNFQKSEKQLFQNAAFFPNRVFPWAGFSFGWTLKR